MQSSDDVMVKSLVSVIIPAYQAQAFLAQAIASVLAQDYRPLEVIVVDDGSSDDTSAVAAACAGIQIYRQENQGCAVARNTGIAHAHGEFFAFLDADDLWPLGRLSKLIDLLKRTPTLDLAYGNVEQFRQSTPNPEAKALNLPGPLPVPMAGSIVVRADFFHKVGPFSPTWKVGEFIDWYLRAIELGMRSAALPDVVLRRRIHGTNLGIRERESRPDYMRVLKAALDRRRGRQQEAP